MLEMAIVAFTAVAAALALGASVAVHRVAPDRRVNRRLALVLALEGAFLVLTILASPLLGGIGDQTPVWFASLVVLFFLPWAYLAFLAYGLDSPLTRPLRTTLATRIMVATPTASILAGAALVAITRGETGGMPWPGIPLVAALLLVPIFAVVASVDAYRRAERGSPRRARAKAFLAAFVVRDVSFLLFFLDGYATVLVWGNWMVAVDPAPLPPRWVVALHESGYAFFIGGVIVYVPLLAYGVLRTQLFDIDLKIKWGAARAGVVGVVVVAALATAKIAEFYLSETMGLAVGGLVAGLTLFMAPRLNRVADRVADRAAPQVKATPDYLDARKAEVYRAAVETAWEGGSITARERLILDRLREKLALDVAEATRIEHEAARAAASASSGAVAAESSA